MSPSLCQHLQNHDLCFPALQHTLQSGRVENNHQQCKTLTLVNPRCVTLFQQLLHSGSPEQSSITSSSHCSCTTAQPPTATHKHLHTLCNDWWNQLHRLQPAYACSRELTASARQTPANCNINWPYLHQVCAMQALPLNLDAQLPAARSTHCCAHQQKTTHNKPRHPRQHSTVLAQPPDLLPSAAPNFETYSLLLFHRSPPLLFTDALQL